MDWTKLATQEQIDKTVDALQANGFDAIVVENKEQAKDAMLKLIPEGVEIMNNTSITLEQAGIVKEILESGKYKPVRDEFKKMDPKTQGLAMRKLGSAPDYAIGSVHAVTEDGKVLIASRTGSQLGQYVYGANKVIWVVGAQKIVPNVDAGIQRIYEYVLPLESDRSNKAYNMTSGSFVNKLVIYYREDNKERIKIIIVKELLGF